MTFEIPEHLREQIMAMAEAKFANALLEIEAEVQAMAEEYAAKFIDVSTLEGKRLMHVATGRTLTITAKWNQ